MSSFATISNSLLSVTSPLAVMLLMTASASVIVTSSFEQEMTALMLLYSFAESLWMLTLNLTVSPGLRWPLLLASISLRVTSFNTKSPILMLLTALKASMRPVPKKLSFVSVSFFAVVSNVMQMSAGVRSLFFSSIRAMTPATQGAAIEVPLFKLYP